MRKHVDDTDNNPRHVKVLQHQDGSGGAVGRENNLKGDQRNSRRLLDKEPLKSSDTPACLTRFLLD